MALQTPRNEELRTGEEPGQLGRNLNTRINSIMRSVLIIQEVMMQYRVPFFVGLADSLRQDDICLKVAYSEPRIIDGKNDNCDLPTDLGLYVKGRWIFGKRLLWQPLLREIAAADLVITGHANTQLVNYLLVALSFLGIKRVAFWGMGGNRAKNRSKFSEQIRRFMINKVHWCFSYTKGTKAFFTSSGVPEENITIVQNAVDTRGFSELVNSITPAELSIERSHLGISASNHVGLFCGALNPDKGIGFLLEAANEVKRKLSDFHLIIVGGGSERESVVVAARSSAWIHYVGPRFGREKALFFRMADVFLLPGYVGLAILDGFAAGLPLLTTDIPDHRPEIEYLENGRNGLMTQDKVDEYASHVVRFFTEPSLKERLKEGASNSGRVYTIETMVSNFRTGIDACLV